MPSITYPKVSGAWKTARDIYVKVGGTWRLCSYVYAKVSGTWRRAHRKFYFPNGCIVPYWQNMGAIPSGWSHYTSCPDRYGPIGVNSWGLGATASSGAVTLTSASTSNHAGTIYAGYGATGYPACHYSNVLCTTAAGGHSHTVTVDPNNTIPYIKSPFMQLTGGSTYTYPANGYVFGYGTNLGIYGLSQLGFSTTLYWMLQGTGSGTSSASSSATTTAATTSSYAGHSHGGAPYYTGCYAGANMYLHLAGQGGHSHSVNISRTNWFNYQALAPWWIGGTSYSEYGGLGVMVMWPSATAPEGWSICNGTNGTPDMRDRFCLITPNTNYGGWSGGSWYPGFVGTTNNAGSHQHRSPLYPYAVPTSNHYHSNYLGNETHAFSDGRWWAPKLWGIYWIMFTG